MRLNSAFYYLYSKCWTYSIRPPECRSNFISLKNFQKIAKWTFDCFKWNFRHTKFFPGHWFENVFVASYFSHITKLNHFFLGTPRMWVGFFTAYFIRKGDWSLIFWQEHLLSNRKRWAFRQFPKMLLRSSKCLFFLFWTPRM